MPGRWIVAVTYAVFFAAHGITWWLGVIAGLVQGLFLLRIVLPTLPDSHPRMAWE